MILVILLVSVALVIVFIIFFENDIGPEYISCVSAVVGTIISLVAFIATIVLIVNVSGLSVIDERIAMYEEENTRIEEQIAETVTQYQSYESGIFEEVSPDNAVAIVSLYPELKSDVLVQSQINVYVENNRKIKELRDEQISGSVIRWWLYFGGMEVNDD